MQGTVESSITNHTQSTKHKDRKINLQIKEKIDQTIIQALQKYNEHHHIREKLPLEYQAYRVKVVRAFLCAAVPLNKLDKLRSILEENAFAYQIGAACLIKFHLFLKDKQPSEES